MKQMFFNFNNEVDRFEILVNEETGVVQIPGEGGEVLAEYASLQQFAEVYAQARDVKPEHLKNWMLVEHGDVASFILRAGTAGVAAAEIAEDMQAVLEEARMNGGFHPLAIKRIENELQGAADVMDALATSSEQDVARFIYDRLMERYLDGVLERDKTLAFFANLLHTPVAEKAVILDTLEHSNVPYTVAMLSSLYEDAIRAAMDGIGVHDRFTAILVIAQAVPAEDGEASKKQLLTAARMAGRDSVNITSYLVGQHHVKEVAKMMSVQELRESTLFMVDSKPVVVVFSDTIDAELEAERAAEEERRAMEADEDDGYDYDEEYDDDEDEDEDW